MASLHEADVVIMTPGMTFGPDRRYKSIHWHRIICDETHSDHYKGGKGNGWCNYWADYWWGVTGTPLTSSVRDLESVANWLGHWSDGLQLSTLQAPRTSFALQKKDDFHLLAPLLRKLMIRHTKAQRIDGEVALSLPASDCETVWLDMSAAERARYEGLTKRVDGRKHDGALMAMGLEMELGLLARRELCSGITGGGRKLTALIDDLGALRAQEPEMHAVVFTMSRSAYAEIVRRVGQAGFEVCGFSGCSKVAERHATIRAFQESVEERKPGVSKVFVATIKVGNVGITLTAATRVYLMEPCLDPAMEVQAAGRIHRLGQTRDVLVKRFVYRRSIETALLELHAKIENGEIAIADNLFPKAALRILSTDGNASVSSS